MLKAVERYLPPNLFIYFFGVAFRGSGLAMLGSGLIASTAIVLGARAQSEIDDSILYLVYLAFAEATIGGMLMTLLWCTGRRGSRHSTTRATYSDSVARHKAGVGPRNGSGAKGEE